MLIGDTSRLENKTAIIYDDICDSGEILIKIVENLQHTQN
jgi:phosphoribosylpyrophosphate synthetase